MGLLRTWAAMPLSWFCIMPDSLPHPFIFNSSVPIPQVLDTVFIYY